MRLANLRRATVRNNEREMMTHSQMRLVSMILPVFTFGNLN